MVDRTKTYSLTKAISLVKKTSFSSFKGKIELHLSVKEKGLKRNISLPHPIPSKGAKKEKKLSLTTEKKFPLIHLVIADLETKDQIITENIQAILDSVGPKNIKKAVLAATMGPGVKIDLANLSSEPKK